MKFLIFNLLACIILVNGDDTPSRSGLRIVGGQETTIEKYPFAAAMLSSGVTNPPVFTQACGASILTHNTLLSAASCYSTNGVIQPVANWQARVGSTTANTGGYVHSLLNIERHQSFNHQTLVNDIAVLRTATSITFEDNIAQASIAGTAYNLGDNVFVTAIGWGITERDGPPSQVLREVEVITVRQQDCVNLYSSYPYIIGPNVVCAGWLDVGLRDQCQGDFGGPLIHGSAVVGVQSWNQECGNGNYPTINTRVSSYTRWIINTAVAFGSQNVHLVQK